jgi:glycosyltransferase involved in cell wall biosynthesis
MSPAEPKLRIATVWAAPSRLVDISVRYERYLRGFQALGHDAFAVCLPESAEGFKGPVELCPSPGRMADPDFWRPLRLDCAVVMTWLGLPEVVSALKAACPKVVAIADSDGLVGERVHVRATLYRSVYQHKTLLARLGGAKFWLQRFLWPSRSFDASGLLSAGFADRITVCNDAAMVNLWEFFNYHRRPDLVAKVAVAPYPVDDFFLSRPVRLDRARQVVAIGRWDDPQKDAGLLAATIARAARRDPSCDFRIVGPGGDAAFGPLCRRHKQVRYLGVQPPGIVADLLSRSRALLLSSRWESGPIVANEALCLGCAVVGPDHLPAVASYVKKGPYGTASRGRSARRLAAAVLAELAEWDEGQREPAEIASYWRPEFSPSSVCRRMLLPEQELAHA